MLREAQPLEHAHSPCPIPGRDHQITVNIGTHFARIQPPGEHRALQHDRANTLTGERTRDFRSKRIDGEIARPLLVALVTFRAHWKAITTTGTIT
jgi:hypothetical protein